MFERRGRDGTGQGQEWERGRPTENKRGTALFEKNQHHCRQRRRKEQKRSGRRREDEGMGLVPGYPTSASESLPHCLFWLVEPMTVDGRTRDSQPLGRNLLMGQGHYKLTLLNARALKVRAGIVERLLALGGSRRHHGRSMHMVTTIRRVRVLRLRHGR
jgi:hypothetical protein